MDFTQLQTFIKIEQTKAKPSFPSTLIAILCDAVIQQDVELKKLSKRVATLSKEVKDN